MTRAFDPDQIYKMEIMVLRTLDWCLGTHTPLHFTGYYLTKGVLFIPDKMQGRAPIKKVPSYLKRYVEFFAGPMLTGLQVSGIHPFIDGGGHSNGVKTRFGHCAVMEKVN